MSQFPDFGQVGDFSSLDARLESMALGDDDIAIYDFGGEGYDTLGELEDSANELNSDTFGGDGPVGRDFDFSAQGQGAAPAPKQTPAWNLDDDFLLGPRSNVPRPPPANQPPAPRMRTLEEIEAELLAANRSPPPFVALPPPSAPQQQASRPRTLEEIEAEMFKAAGPSPPAPLPPMQQQQGPPAISMQNLPAVFQNRPMPPVPQQFQAMPFNKMAAANRPEQFPPLGANGPVVPPPRPQADQHSLGQLHGARMAILHRFPNGQIPPDQIAILQSLDAAIQEAERRELLLRKKAHKLVELSSHNGLMSNSEKDFITRIQLSQLFNSLGPNGAHDPLKDDFYFTVFTAIRGARLQAQQGGKRRNQMTKMATQVQRIVDDARKKPRSAQLSLDGALGKIALRTRSAPKQLLQVSKSPSTPSLAEGAASPLSLLSKAGKADGQQGSLTGMTKRVALLEIEQLYSIILELEQIKRMQPQVNLLATAQGEMQHEHQAALAASQRKYATLVAEMWDKLHVTKPLETSVPHPFISLLVPNKGKRLLPRVLRHIDSQQTLTLFTLLLATFGQLDVVREAPLLDLPADTLAIVLKDTKRTRSDIEAGKTAFNNAIAPPFLTTLSKLPLRIVTGMMSLLIERNDVRVLAKSKAGIAFFTLFLSRAELLKQGQATEVAQPDDAEKTQWTNVFNALFSSLQGQLATLFPSTRYAANLPFGVSLYNPSTSGLDLDAEDETIWSFLAAFAVCSDMNQQQHLVTEIRDKVLECVTGAANKNISPEQSARKIRNVNLMLHALGLDASQIAATA